jgi:hypothetical protein
MGMIRFPALSGYYRQRVQCPVMMIIQFQNLPEYLDGLINPAFTVMTDTHATRLLGSHHLSIDEQPVPAIGISPLLRT